MVHRAIPGVKSDGQEEFTVPYSTNVNVAMMFGDRVFAIDTRDLSVVVKNSNSDYEFLCLHKTRSCNLAGRENSAHNFLHFCFSHS